MKKFRTGWNCIIFKTETKPVWVAITRARDAEYLVPAPAAPERQRKVALPSDINKAEQKSKLLYSLKQLHEQADKMEKWHCVLKQMKALWWITPKIYTA